MRQANLTTRQYSPRTDDEKELISKNTKAAMEKIDTKKLCAYKSKVKTLTNELIRGYTKTRCGGKRHNTVEQINKKIKMLKAYKEAMSTGILIKDW